MCNGIILFVQGYRGRKKVLKRLTAPKSWMLDKLGGVFVSILMPLREKTDDFKKTNLFHCNKSYQLSVIMQRMLTITSFFRLLQAPRPSTGPHKLRESLPLIVFLRNRLKYALTYDEVKKITMQRLIKVDGKVRTDKNFPTGFMGKIKVYEDQSKICCTNVF